jgi:DNA-binding CsgD family transcriptional regulator
MWRPDSCAMTLTECPHADHHPAWGQRTAVGRAAKRMKADGHTAKDIAKYLGVSRATFYRDLGDVAA